MIPTTSVESHPMRTIAFALFPQHEQSNFRASCRRWMKSPDDFVVSAEEQDPPPAGETSLQREVIVIHKPTGKGRRYTAGGGTRWNDEFDDDLQASYFRRL